mmetsp:Transcript_34233/g.63100  ORF Transcript_34233/g.63100 Transcript_34233/m.63100 type:complete len:345 (+) Transcript_34233:146-1180(+)
MKSTTKITKAAKVKKADRGIPFEEMCRLMRVYGPIKCLRKRKSSAEGGGNGAVANTKIDSVKRKFYRWFPDLEERFVKDKGGFYRPKFGHMVEMCYRQDRRAKDGEILNKKRNRNRRRQQQQQRVVVVGGVERKTVIGVDNSKRAEISSSILAYSTARSAWADCAPLSPISSHAVSPSPSYYDQQLIRVKDIDATDLEFDQDRTVSDSIIADTEPLDNSFIAEQGIFDDVEESFFGSYVQDCPSLLESSSSSSSSCSTSSGDQCSNSSSWGSTPVIDHMLDKPMDMICPSIQKLPYSSISEEQGSNEISRTRDSLSIEDMLYCCENILASDGDDIPSTFQYGAL